MRKHTIVDTECRTANATATIELLLSVKNSLFAHLAAALPFGIGLQEFGVKSHTRRDKSLAKLLAVERLEGATLREKRRGSSSRLPRNTTRGETPDDIPHLVGTCDAAPCRQKI